MSFLKKNYFLILSLILCFWAIKPLFAPGFFPMHDNEQIARLFDLDLVLKAWQIPPRIVPNLGFGYGYPFFNFYPPFVYYVAEIFKLIGFSYIWSTKLMIGLGFVLSFFFMYLLSREFFGRLGGVVSALFYTYAPYHAVDVYVRGALPEFWSMVFLPAIFWAFYKLKQKSQIRYLFFAIIFNSFLILTHNLVMVMLSPFLVIWIIFLLLGSQNKKGFLVNSFIAVFFPFLLTAYFWIPSFFEKQYTMINLLTTELANYFNHFVYLRQFWDSPWGYGGSLYGLYDGLSFQIGKIHIVLSIVAILFALNLYVVKETKRVAKIVFIFAIFLIFSVFMATFHSKFIWDNVQFLWYIQFPWRFLIFSSLFSSLLVGALFLINFPKKVRIFLAAIFIIILIYQNMNYFQPEKYFLSATDVDYTNTEKIRFETSSLAAEYVPKGISTRKTDINTTVVNISKDEIAKKSYDVVSGKMNVEEVKNLPQEKMFKVSSSEKAVLRVNTFSFPGWKVFVDGRQVQYSDNNKFKLITLGPLVGTHSIDVKFTDTPIRLLSNWISLISIIILFIIGFVSIFRNYNLKRLNLL